MFYKDTDKQNINSNSRFAKGEDNQASVVPSNVQKILDEKKEQLDKAMKFYN
jgi:hypothetical protein